MLGNEFIHIRYHEVIAPEPNSCWRCVTVPSLSGLTHELCDGNTTYPRCDVAVTSTPNRLVRYCHLQCPTNGFSLPRMRRLISVSLLQTCRQTYLEGTRILYSTNTFTFLQPSYNDLAFSSFFPCLTLFQLHTLTKLQVSIGFHSLGKVCRFGEMARMITRIEVTPLLAKQLTSLRTLHQCLFQTDPPRHPRPGICEETCKGMEIDEDNPCVKRLIMFAQLPLQHLMVVVGNLGRGRSRFSLEQKDTCTREIRHRLLTSVSQRK